MPGTDDDTTLAIDQVSELSGISTGTFEINGVAFDVDVTTDSLDDVIADINASSAGAEAEYEESSGRFYVRATHGEELELSDGTSGFFTALNVSEGTYERAERSTGFGVRLKSKGMDNLSAFVRAPDEVLGFEADPSTQGLVGSVRKRLMTVLDKALRKVGIERESEATLTPLGLDLLRDENGNRGAQLDPTRFKRAIQRRPEDVYDLFLATQETDGHRGILAGVGDEIRATLKGLAAAKGVDTGLLIDFFA